MRAEVRWNAERVIARVRRHVQTGLRDAGEHLRSTVKDLLMQSRTPRGGRSASSPGSPPAMMTGALKDSIVVFDEEEDNGLFRLKVGTNLAYAFAHEFGANIRPVKGQALAIPIGLRGAQLAEQAGSGGLRSLDLKLIPLPGKPPILVEQTRMKTKEKSRPVFVLVPYVDLPMRPFMRPGKAAAAAEVRQIMADALEKALAG